jgi:hypothetical protein
MPDLMDALNDYLQQQQQQSQQQSPVIQLPSLGQNPPQPTRPNQELPAVQGTKAPAPAPQKVVIGMPEQRAEVNAVTLPSILGDGGAAKPAPSPKPVSAPAVAAIAPPTPDGLAELPQTQASGTGQPVGGYPIASPSVSKAPDLPPVLTPSQLAQQKLSADEAQGSGIDRLSKKHPFLGGLARVADIIGSTLLPGVSAFIPGSSLNHQMIVGNDQRSLNSALGNEDTAAQIAERKANTDAIENPSKDEGKTITTADGIMQFNPATKRYDIKAGDTTDGFTTIETPAGPLNINKHTGQAQHVTVDGKVIGPKIETETRSIVQPDGKSHDIVFDKDTHHAIADLGEAGYSNKPQVINVNAGNAALDRETKQFGTPHQKIVTTATDQLAKINDAADMLRTGTAEAVALAVPKVLTALVSGAGTGVRITQAEINSIGKARGVQGDVEGWMNSIQGKGSLTKTQRDQLTGILADVRSHIQQKMAIANDTLDTINGASSRDEIIAADKAARQRYTDLEKGSNTPPAGASAEVHDKTGKLIGHIVSGKYVALGQ